MKLWNGALYTMIRGLAAGLCLTGPATRLRADSATPPAGPEALLRRLQGERLPLHPLTQAALQRAAQAQSGEASARGYFDTQWFASGATATWPRPVPGATFQPAIGVNTTAIQTGVEQAFRPGVFVAAGVAERFIRPDGDASDYQQTLAGAQLRVPLMRNLGHAQWRWEQRAAGALAEAARQDLIETLQLLRFESDTAFVSLLQAVADAEAFRRAEQRVQTLLRQTETLVELKAIPEYQLFPSRVDAVLREEEVITAEQRIAAATVRLETLLGPAPELGELGSDALTAWAQGLVDSTLPGTSGREIERRGAIAGLHARIEAARAAEARARDDARPDLALALSATWQGESADDLRGSQSLADDDRTGYEAALVLRMPLQRRRERAAVQQEEARRLEVEAELEHRQRLLTAALVDSRTAAENARMRVRLVSQAVENARLTLDAEAERFRLGEGRSRDVLDAQKDLTAAELRRNAAAGALLQAEAAMAFAAAYPDGLLPQATFPDGYPAPVYQSLEALSDDFLE